jgi:uncharacterized cupin superfamily protein
MKNPSNVIHENDVAWTETTRGRGFRYKRKLFGEAAGGVKLGFSLYEVPPGASAFPLHFHFANEEAIYILDGSGTLRLNGEEIRVSRGHFIALPPGPAHAHRLINSSDQPLTYICVSTMIEPEVCIYPDSKKVGVAVGPRKRRTLAATFKQGSEVDYYHGEPDA